MEKRTLIALAVSFAVLGFYPVILQQFYPDYYTKESKAAEDRKKNAAETGTSDTGLKADVKNPLPKADGSFIEGADVAFKNQTLDLRFNSRGGAIRQADFLSFKDAEASKPIRFFSLQNAEGAPTLVHLAESNVSGVTYVPTYKIVQESGTALTASAELAKDLWVTKRYDWESGRYHSALNVKFENRSDKPIEFRYQIFAGTSIPPRHSIDNQYVEANFYAMQDGKGKIRHLNESKAEKRVPSVGTVEWVAVKDRHFSVIVKPKPGQVFTGLVEGLGSHQFRASLLSDKKVLAPHGVLDHEFLVYIGPNDVNELAALGLDPIVNFGKLDVIGKLLVGGLEMTHKIFRNYGVSIIVLTALLNLVLFPLTRTSYMSMKRMQLIQPQMNKLREQHKKHPEKLNRDMMELYKKHKVNPFGGCLPMVLQMPVFIALYVALSKAVVLVGAKFLWVKDLSSPDSIPIPFNLPFLGNEVHALPLLMTVAMALQQKFTQIKMEGQDPAMEAQQKMMTVMMPVIFCFIFYTMPSGLVLYWLTNTLLMTAYQLKLKNMTLA